MNFGPADADEVVLPEAGRYGHMEQCWIESFECFCYLNSSCWPGAGGSENITARDEELQPSSGGASPCRLTAA